MTPILAAIPVDTLIWIVLLLIGAIGSIASNARKAQRAAQAAPKSQQQPDAAQQRAEQIREQLAARLAGVVQQRFELPPLPAPAAAPAPITVPRPRPVAAKPVVPAPMPAPSAAVPHGTAAFRGMFERGNLARAIVAAEVLGPPKSLQEQSIWSPRHSEP